MNQLHKMNPSAKTGHTNDRAEKASADISSKIIQYLMLLLLLLLIFIVSAYAGAMHLKHGLRNQTQEEGGQDNRKSPGTVTEDTEESDENESEKEGDAGSSRGTIVLDAGHGGIDPGVSGTGGSSERELNLILAKKLEVLLTEEGYHVIQTRPTEEGLYDENQPHKKAQDMQRRCAIIEEAQPILTVSIHQNSYPDSSVSGPQVFYFAQSKEGERLASCIQNCMNEQLAPQKPKSHKGNESYYILRRSAGTAVIVECGFLTNPEEEAKLQDDAYQDRVVNAIRDGILNYLDTPV